MAGFLLARLLLWFQHREDVVDEQSRLESLRKERSEVQSQVGRCRESKEKLQQQIKWEASELSHYVQACIFSCQMMWAIPSIALQNLYKLLLSMLCIFVFIFDLEPALLWNSFQNMSGSLGMRIIRMWYLVFLLSVLGDSHYDVLEWFPLFQAAFLCRLTYYMLWISGMTSHRFR